MPRHHTPITPDLEAAVVAAYPRYKHNTDLAREVGIHATSVAKIIKRHGLPPYRRKYSAAIDETFFDQIDTPEKAYFLGWMYSDGHNQPKYRQAGIRLQSGDIEMLRKLRRYIGYEGNINVYTEQPAAGTVVKSPRPSERAGLVWKNARLCASLCRLGCVPNKTRQLVFPSSDILPLHLVSDFMRGYVEGDGSFGAYDRGKHYIFALQGTQAFIEGATRVIAQHTGVQCVMKAANETNWFFKTAKTGRRPVLAILDWLYADCGDRYLERKYATYMRMKQAYEALPDEPYIDPVTRRWVPAKYPKGKAPPVAAGV